MMMGDSELLAIDSASRDPPEFCEAWLKHGICSSEKAFGKCDKMHAYPPTWTDEDVLKHKHMIEALIAHGTESESDSESELALEEPEQEAAVRVLQKFVQDDSDDEEDVQELGPGDQWRAVGTKRGHQSEPHARKKQEVSPRGVLQPFDSVTAASAEAGMDIPRQSSPAISAPQQIVFEFADGQALTSVPANQLERCLPMLQDPDALITHESEIYVAVESPMGPRTMTPLQAADGTVGFSRARLLWALSQGLVDHEDEFRIGNVSYSPSERLCTVQLEL